MIVVIRNPNRKLLEGLPHSKRVPDARHFGTDVFRRDDVMLVDMRE